MKMELSGKWEIITISNTENMKFCVLILLCEASSHRITVTDRHTPTSAIQKVGMSFMLLSRSWQRKRSALYVHISSSDFGKKTAQKRQAFNYFKTCTSV